MTRTFSWILLVVPVLLWSCAETAVSPETGKAAAVKIEIPNARMPFDGVLTGGQPTAEQLETAARAALRIGNEAGLTRLEDAVRERLVARE